MITPTLKRLAVPIDSVQPHPRNARQGDVGALAESLGRFGQVRPIVVQEATGHILAGNHLWKAAKALGWPRIAVVRVDVDDDTALAYLVADNRTADLGTYDDPALGDILRELAEHDLLEGTGYDGEDVDRFLADLAREAVAGEGRDVDEDAGVPDELPDDPVSKPGEVYELGPHRLMCGDATDPAAMAILMDGALARIVVTSPPYNQRLDGFKPSGMQRENPAWVERMARAYADSRPEDEYQEEQLAILGRLLDVTSVDASLFYNHKPRYRGKVVVSPIEWLARSAWRLRQEVIWDRGGSITLNARMFMPVDERIYWLTRSGDFVFNDTAEIKALGTIWAIPPRPESKVSAAYPMELPRRCIAACSDPGDIVLDPFAGSGTTLLAAHALGRRAHLMELDPRYCDVVRARYEAAVVNVTTEVVA